MGKFNKATAAVLSGAVVTILGVFVDLAPEVIGAVQTLLTAILVWVVPHK